MNFLLRGFSLFAVPLLMISTDPEGCLIKLEDKKSSSTDEVFQIDNSDQRRQKITETPFAGLAGLEEAMRKENWSTSPSDDAKKVSIYVNKNSYESIIGRFNKALESQLTDWKKLYSKFKNSGIEKEHIIYWLCSPYVAKVAREQTRGTSDIEDKIKNNQDKYGYHPGLNIIFTNDAIRVERSIIVTESTTEKEIIIAKLIYSLKNNETEFFYELHKTKSTKDFIN